MFRKARQSTLFAGEWVRSVPWKTIRMNVHGYSFEIPRPGFDSLRNTCKPIYHMRSQKIFAAKFDDMPVPNSAMSCPSSPLPGGKGNGFVDYHHGHGVLKAWPNSDKKGGNHQGFSSACLTMNGFESARLHCLTRALNMEDKRSCRQSDRVDLKGFGTGNLLNQCCCPNSSAESGRADKVAGQNGSLLPAAQRQSNSLRVATDIDKVAVEPVAAVIDGKTIAQEIKKEITHSVSRMRDAVGKVPGLAVVLVGARKDSQTYVCNKKKACEEVGIMSLGIDLPEDSTEDEVLRAVMSFNDNPSVHGVLVQLPLPQHINEEKILNAVSIEKDVDGFHPLNMGQLAMQGREPLFVPCTPKGCIELLLRSGIHIMGKRAVVIGHSNVVGMPAAMLLQRHHATVTIVHSYTKNPADITREADIIISAAGVPNLVRGDWLKPGAVVIDVGINPVEDPSTQRGYRLVGDVCFEEATRIVSAITPVPGGVGPMTIAMLLSNTLESAKRAYGVA